MKRSSSLLALVATVFVLMPVGAAVAQVPDSVAAKRDWGWFAVGLGPSARFDLSYVYSANIGRRRVWQLVVQGGSDIFRGEALHAAGISYGRSAVDRWSRVAVTGGPAVVRGRGRYDAEAGERERFVTGGLVMNVQVIFTPVRELGVGLDLHGCLNPRVSEAGVRVILVLEGNK
jgi:hypothetical protein